MNIPATITGSNVASAVISAGRCVLLYGLITNGSSSDRWYVLLNATSVPSMGGVLGEGIRSGRIAAGTSWRPFPVDSKEGAVFNSGVVLLSCTDATYTALSAADASYTAWAAPLQ